MGDCDIPAFVVSFHRQWGDEILTSATVYNRHFRTAHGVGIGSTLGNLRRHHKVDRIIYNEGIMSAFVPELVVIAAYATEPMIISPKVR